MHRPLSPLGKTEAPLANLGRVPVLSNWTGFGLVCAGKAWRNTWETVFSSEPKRAEEQGAYHMNVLCHAISVIIWTLHRSNSGVLCTNPPAPWGSALLDAMATERFHGAQEDGFETSSPPLRRIITRLERFHPPDLDSGLSRALRTPRPRTRFLAKANTFWERFFRVLFGLSEDPT